MKEILNKLKNKELDVLLLILLITSTTFFSILSYYDELWNFANVYKMLGGYKIYEELNVIINPLFFYISQIFFIILGANMLAFRIYNFAIYSAFFMLIYLIFKALKIPRRRAILYMFIITFIFKGMLVTGANYNILVVIPILIAILLILKQKENAVSLGILLFLTFMIKQNVFVYFGIGIFIYKIINRTTFKKLFLNLFKIYGITLICILAFLLYMYLDNNLYNFINYCFLGISEFSANNFNIAIKPARYLIISVSAIIITLAIKFIFKKIKIKIDDEVIKNIKILLSFGTPLLLMAFPIVNFYHATLASTVVLMEFMYLIESILIKKIKINRETEKMIYIAALVIYIYAALFTRAVGVYKGRDKIVLIKEGSYCGTLMFKEDYEDIQIICDYIKEQEKNGKNIKILSYKANLYMVPLNKNNGMFDLPNKGNLGSGGEEGLINEIKELDNTLILIQTDEKAVFWQESKKVREYIINNYEKLEEVQEYSVYYIK